MAASDLMSLLSMYTPEDLAALLASPAPSSLPDPDNSGAFLDSAFTAALQAQPQTANGLGSGLTGGYPSWQDAAAEQQSTLLQVGTIVIVSLPAFPPRITLMCTVVVACLFILALLSRHP